MKSKKRKSFLIIIISCHHEMICCGWNQEENLVKDRSGYQITIQVSKINGYEEKGGSENDEQYDDLQYGKYDG